MLAQSDLRRKLGDIEAPTLVLHRADDALVSIASVRALAEAIPERGSSSSRGATT
jgi:pimeloyl-ACP methyl ester carboxylesterase